LLPTRYSRNGNNPHFAVGLLLLLLLPPWGSSEKSAEEG